MSAPIKTLKIDGQDVSARGDQTILEVAREHDIYIPTLCNLEGLSPVGACRLCLVEVKGSSKLLPACVTTVEEGMEVVTNSERLRTTGAPILEMLFAERNHICSVCVSNGHCELQTLAQKLGMTHVHMPYLYPQLPVDASHERFVLDHNRCILCTRCVRVCDEIEGAHTWDVMGRGHRLPRHHRPERSRGATRRPARAAASACTSARRARCPRRASRWPRCRSGRQFLPYLTLMRERQR